MKADNYLKELTKRIEDPDARKEIMREEICIRIIFPGSITFDVEREKVG